MHDPMVANHHRHHHVEQKLYVDVLVPHEMEEIVHVPKMIPQKRVVQQMAEQIVGVLVPVTQEEIAHAPRERLQFDLRDLNDLAQIIQIQKIKL